MTTSGLIATDVYSASVAEAPPGGLSDFHFAAAGSGSRRATVVVEVYGEETWVADFAAPAPGIHCLSGLFRVPDDSGLGVLECGTAFIGDVLRPREIGPVSGLGPVVEHLLAPDGTWALLVSPWEVCGIGHGGEVWITDRLADYGMRIVSLSDEIATFVANEGDAERTGQIDLRTGRVGLHE